MWPQVERSTLSEVDKVEAMNRTLSLMQQSEKTWNVNKLVYCPTAMRILHIFYGIFCLVSLGVQILETIRGQHCKEEAICV